MLKSGYLPSFVKILFQYLVVHQSQTISKTGGCYTSAAKILSLPSVPIGSNKRTPGVETQDRPGIPQGTPGQVQ